MKRGTGAQRIPRTNRSPGMNSGSVRPLARRPAGRRRNARYIANYASNSQDCLESDRGHGYFTALYEFKLDEIPKKNVDTY